MYIYYPSCNFQRQFPETAAKIRSYLFSQDDVQIAGCCRVTNDLPAAGDTIVTVCLSCMHILEEVRPDIPQLNLFSFLLTRKDFPWPDLAGENITVQDCFRARGRHALQDDVRKCLVMMHAVPVEMEHNRDEETFDGSFLFHPPVPANAAIAPHYFTEEITEHITPLPKEEWAGQFREHAGLYTTERVVCYCNLCTASAREGGADAVHLAELLFP